MNKLNKHQTVDDPRLSSIDEAALLETALRDGNGLLRDSLRVDERRRRRRRIVSVSLLIGGIVMGSTIVAVLAGWLTLAAPPPVTHSGAPRTEQTVNKQAWVERILGLRDHMHTAFGVGPDLTLLDPDEGLEVVQEAWPQIERADVKTGLLKTFAFSKALPETHPKVLQVLHLGMTDADPKIRAYAASYLEEYANEDFKKNPSQYEAWYAKFADMTPQEVVRLNKSNASQGTQAKALAPGDDAAIDRAEALSAEGWRLWQSRELSEAIAKFDEAVKLDPEATAAWNGLGWARFNSGDSEQAVKAFETCVTLEPEHPAALNGLGQIYLMWRDYDNAEKFLTKAAPQAPAVWFGLARLYMLTGKYDEAQMWIEKALSQQPDDATLAKLLDAAKRGALPDDLRREIEPPGKPENTPTAEAATQGWQRFNQGNLRSAERNFRRALSKDPENLQALNGLGFSLLASGKAAAAKSYFEKCLELEPDAAGPLNGLARCLKAEGKVDEAIATWERMYAKYHGPNAAAVGLATTYLERGEHAKAIPFFEELVKAQPENEEFRKGLNAAQKGAQD